MTDYKQYLLYDERLYRDLWDSDEAFRRYSHSVYLYLDRMPRGHELRFDRYAMPHLQWIIWTCCIHMYAGKNALEYCFADDYTAYKHEQ